MERDIFNNLSPLDHRYYASNETLFNQLAEFFSENAYIRYELKVEAALARVLAKRGICSQEVAGEIAAACNQVNPEEVYLEEEITKHNIRALVNCIQRKVSENARPFVHFTATSVDIMDSATAMRFKEATDKIVIPKCLELEQQLISIARREKATLQVGRTHGQHAVPITFGFAMAEYVSRFGSRIEQIRETALDLRGKIAGAVGAYNASSLFFDDPQEFETEVLWELGLKPANYSNQIVEPEYLTDYIHAVISAFGVLANLADDIRHLQRTEIGEVGEAFDASQVGSSTMPHKRNPWNFEHVKSMWKEFMPRMMTLYLDQISEHQRDLTNSASGRFVPEIVIGFVAAVDRLNRVLRKLVVDQAKMNRNFDSTKEMVIAEPLYILLASLGHPDAHEAVRLLTLESQKTGKTLRELLAQKTELFSYWERLTPRQRVVLEYPEKYTGGAELKTESICNHWEKQLNIGAV
ncbi:MAG TPA: lyase family protein [Bacillota bacterium]|nr:lyase family protein [Bacillota bacterium]